MSTRNLKIAVIAWDVCHNAVGRAFMLADMLRRRYRVELVGARFARYGGRVWPPVAHAGVEIRSFAGADFPRHLELMKEFASGIDADVLLVSKPRLPALLLAALACRIRSRPVLLDIDDHEAAFFADQRPISVAEIESRWREPDARTPFGELWTRHCETLIPAFAHRSTSNPLLQEKFGGTIIPHARDEERFDPACFDRFEVRSRLGIGPNERVVLFIGTPRRHKGLLAVRDALARIGRPEYRLWVMGHVTDPNLLTELMRGPPGQVRLFPGCSFMELPRHLMLGDLLCLLQEAGHPVSHYQVPAKFTDALAMGLPILASSVGPMKALCERGLAEAVGQDELPEKLLLALERSEELRVAAREKRRVFLEEFSYRAVLPRLEEAIERVLEAGPPDELGRLLDRVEGRLAPQAKVRRAKKTPAVTATANGEGLDIVFFWKQNDSSLYGRRQDMLAQYFTRSPRVRQVVHFDAPLSLRRLLWELRHLDRMSHGKLVVANTLARALGWRHGPRFKAHSYLYLGPSLGGRRPGFLGIGEHGFTRFVARRLRAAGVRPERAVFFVYPVHFQFPALWRSLRPALTVVDLVDDQRGFYPPGSPKREVIWRNLKEVVETADLVLTNCGRLQRLAGELGKQAVLVPNGVELENEMDRSGIPDDLAAVPPPRIGYAGNLSSRLDLALLERLAGERLGSLVFVGSAHLDRKVLDLRRYPNVYFLGVRPYPEVRRYIKYFDVALLPHTRGELTESMHPLKLPLYLALGVPVVSTDIENLGELRQLVEVAVTYDDFLVAVKRALSSRPAGSGRVPKVLLDYDWSKRAEYILDMIEKKL